MTITTALIYNAKGDVVNRVVIDTELTYTPLPSFSVFTDADGKIGDRIVDGELVSVEE